MISNCKQKILLVPVLSVASVMIVKMLHLESALLKKQKRSEPVCAEADYPELGCFVNGHRPLIVAIAGLCQQNNSLEENNMANLHGNRPNARCLVNNGSRNTITPISFRQTSHTQLIVDLGGLLF